VRCCGRCTVWFMVGEEVRCGRKRGRGEGEINTYEKAEVPSISTPRMSRNGTGGGTENPSHRRCPGLGPVRAKSTKEIRAFVLILVTLLLGMLQKYPITPIPLSSAFSPSTLGTSISAPLSLFVRQRGSSPASQQIREQTRQADRAE